MRHSAVAVMALSNFAMITNALMLGGTVPPPSRHASIVAAMQDDISTRMKEAMKGGAERKAELLTLRGVLTAMTVKQKESGADTLSDAEVQAVLAKLAKMRKESIEMFAKGGKEDAVAKEKAELAILQEYLPEEADEATVRGWIDEAVAAACPDGPDKSKMGMVMGKLMAAHKGEFDGKQASKWVSEALSG